MPNAHSTASIAGHPIHPMLVPFPIAFFPSAFLCDLVYWATLNPIWCTVAEWLLGAGVVTALVAALAGFTDLLGDARIRSLNIAWWHMGGNLVIVLLEAANWGRRYAMGTGAVIPWGTIMSLFAVAGLLVTGWLGGQMVYRHRVAVRDEPPPETRNQTYRRAA